MSLGDPYITAEQLKDRLGIDDDADDPELTSAADAASRAVNRFCGRQFQKADAPSERVFPVTGGVLLVDDFHTTDGLIVGGVAYSAEAFELEPENGVVDGEPGWPYWRIYASGLSGRVTVTAAWGWADVPDPIVEATAMTAIEIFKMRDAPFGIQGMADFGLIRIRENARVESLLYPYRRLAAVIA